MPASRSPSSRLSTISQVCSRRSGVPVLSSVLWPVHGSTSLHQGLSDIGMGASATCVPTPISRQLAGCCRVSASSPSPSRSSAPVMPGSGHCYKLGEVGPPSFHLGPVSLHDHRYLLGEVVPFRCLGVSLSRFLVLPSPPARTWQQLLSHMASLERFLLRGHSHMRPLQWWCLKDLWSRMSDDPSLPVPLSPD